MLERLAGDGDWDVRRAAAENPNTPPEILAKLLYAPDEEVRRAVLRNPKAGGRVYARAMVE